MNQDAFRKLISGEKTGITARLSRAGLKGLSFCYGLGVGLRNRAFDHGWKRIERPPVPIVSVGNLTAGGTGKTPFVAHLVNRFRDRGIRVAILSRGYGSLPGEVNDEKLVLDQLCPDTPHLQHKDRVQSAHVAVSEHGAELLILDDGFQHRRLARDLDVVLVDALNPWGYGHLLPRGLLREPPAALRRADLVVLTRADQCSDASRQEILDHLKTLTGGDNCVQVAFTPHRLRNASGRLADLASLAGQQVAAFCGIGNPDGFRQTLDRLDLTVRLFRPFADHHHYTDRDLAEISEQAHAAGASAILTTHKDLVKINRDDLKDLPLWAVDIQTQVLSGDELLEQQLNQLLPAASAAK